MSNIEKNIDGRTKLVGLLATPIGHSLSPRMHNLGYTLKNLNYAYLAFEVGNDELEKVVEGFKAQGAAGFNVSMPNKMKVLEYLDELDDSAKFARASNTVVNRDGKLIAIGVAAPPEPTKVTFLPLSSTPCSSKFLTYPSPSVL